MKQGKTPPPPPPSSFKKPKARPLPLDAIKVFESLPKNLTKEEQKEMKTPKDDYSDFKYSAVQKDMKLTATQKNLRLVAGSSKKMENFFVKKER